MRSLLRPLVLLLAIPVCATALSMLARANWESRWSASLVRQLAARRMRADERLLARYSLATLCGDRRTGSRLPPCGTYNHHSFVIRASAGVGAAGFLFLGVLVGAGHLSRGGRRRRVLLFRPAVCLAAWGTAAAALANAALAALAVLAGALYLFGGPVEAVPVELLLVTGTVAAVWGVGMAAAALAFTPRPTVVVLGRRLDPGSQPALYREVRRMAEAVGAEAPGQVVACLAPVLFVTELKVACLDGTVSGRTLCLPLPLARVLTVDELCALLAHELAHFSRTTEGYARRVVPFYIAAVRALERLDRRAHGIQAAAVWPPKELLRFFLSGMQEAGHNGHDEAEADRQAAAVCGPAALGSALVKVQAFAPAWHAVIGAMFDAVSARTQYVNASQLFAEVVASNAGRERLVGIGQLRAEHPSDRHPMLAERLTALDLPLAAIADAALAAPPAQAAVALVEGYAGIEQALSAAEHELIAATGADLPLPRTQ